MSDTVATSQPLSSVELAWLRVHTPENPSINTVVLVVEGTLDRAQLKERIEDRLLPLARLRQRLESSHVPLARPHWRDHNDFQLTDHLFELTGVGQEETASLTAIVERILSLPMDEALPLWQIHLLDLEGGRSALILRVHAAVADSRASAALALRLVDASADGPIPSTQVGLENQLPLHDLLGSQPGPATATRMLCQLIASRTDRENPFRHPPTHAKTVAWSPPVPIGHLENLTAQHGNTAAEILLAAIGSALRKAAHKLDTPADSLLLRAVVPLDLRKAGDAPLGTRSALGLLSLPVQGSTTASRLEFARNEMERFSTNPENLATLGLDAAMSLSMTEIEERSIRLICEKASVALAVLDGPAETQSLCGRTVSQLVWWPALNRKFALGISLVAYAGQIRFGVVCDQSLTTDAVELAADMATEITPD